MKLWRTTLLVLLPLLSLVSHAQQRSDNEMRDIALQCLHSVKSNFQHRVSTSSDAVDNMRLLCTSNELLNRSDMFPAFYVYAHNNGAPGFVIVSADERSPEVLGYSYTDNFSYISISPSVQSVLRDYACRLDEQTLTEEHLQLPRKSNGIAFAPEQTEPLLGNICFNQRAPYNGYCPVYQNQVCLTGCTAVAMAQVMRYYKYPNCMSTAHGNISYASTWFANNVWDCSFGVFDWDNIAESYVTRSNATADIKLSQDPIFLCTGMVPDDEYEGYLVIQYLSNASGATFDGDIQLIVTDDEGHPVALGSDTWEIESLSERSYYKQFYIMPGLPSTLPDGTYRVYVTAKPAGSNTWSLARKAASTSKNDRYDKSTSTEYYEVVEKQGCLFTLLGKTYSCSYNNTQAEAVARLCASCAYSVQADFGPSSTSAGNRAMRSSLVDYMGYSDQMYSFGHGFLSAEEIHQQLQNELAEKRPVIVSGRSGSNAHAFLIDGYEHRASVPYYHVNWGWNGQSNGYFLLTYLKPTEAGSGGSSVNYADSLVMTFNIKPNDNIKKGHLMGALDLTVSATSVTEGDRLSVAVGRLYNLGVTPMSGKVTVCAMNAAGKMYELGQLMNVSNLPGEYYYTSLSGTYKIGAAIPTGDYTIVLRSQDTGMTDAVTALNADKPQVHITSVTAVDKVEADFGEGALYQLNGTRTQHAGRHQIVIGKGKKWMTH